MTKQASKFLVIILAIFALVFSFWAKESKLEGVKRFAGPDGQSGRVQWNSRRSQNNRDQWTQDNQKSDADGF